MSQDNSSSRSAVQASHKTGNPCFRAWLAILGDLVQQWCAPLMADFCSFLFRPRILLATFSKHWSAACLKQTERNIYLSLKVGKNLGFFKAASRWDPANSFVCHLGNVFTIHIQFPAYTRMDSGFQKLMVG